MSLERLPFVAVPVARTFYVTMDGQDINEGTSLTSPLATIAEGLARAAALGQSAVVIVQPGEYTVPPDTVIPANCALYGYDLRVTKLSLPIGQEENNMFLLSNGCKARGFTFTGLRHEPYMGNARTTAWMFGRASAFNNGGNPGINGWDVSRVTDMSGMFGRATAFNQPIGNWNVAAVERFWTLTNLGELRLGFLEATAFDQDLGAWRLRSLGTDLTNFGAPALSRANYSRLLTGWANQMRANNGPFAIALNVSNLSYDGTLNARGAAYETAIAGRAALVGANRLTVTGATDAAANGDYPFGARYQNAAGWYFTNSSVRWTLFDPLGNAQAAGDIPTGANNTPGNVTSWSGVLGGASIKRTGAAWTITGDLLA